MSAAALGICLALAAGSTATQGAVFVPARAFTLAWTHSIERVRWEEDYQVVAGASADTPLLKAVQARVHGSAAGMEPGEGAVLRDGWYHYRPARAMHGELWLTRSQYTADYELCLQGQACQPLSTWLPSDGWRTRLWPCTPPR